MGVPSPGRAGPVRVKHSSRWDSGGVYWISPSGARPNDSSAAVAAYVIPWADGSIPELILDHAASPGFSGSPVYLVDGKIVGILVQNAQGEATGITIARPASVFREMLGKKPQK